MNLVLTIDDVDLDGDARAAARLELPSLKLDLDGYDDFGFSECGCGPSPSFLDGMPVAVSVDGDIVYRGEIVETAWAFERTGWVFTYTCRDLKALADLVHLRARDGRATAAFNLSPADPDFVQSLSGLEVGEIVAKLLTVPATALSLDGYGVGDIDLADPDAPALPSATLADLALLDVVPNQPIYIGGMAHNSIRQFVGDWMPRFVPWIDPATRAFRFFDVNDMPVTHAMVIPGDTGEADPVEPPSLNRSTRGCYTAVEAIGRDVAVVTLSTKDGTLTPVAGPNAAWTDAQQAAWRLSDFERPRDAYDEGTLSGVTLTSATLTSSDTSKAWASNFWSDRQATLYLMNNAGGAVFGSQRLVTSCASMSAGGTATITWDSDVPLDSTSYSRYRLVGNLGPLALVGRKFLVRDPSTGNTGLDTPVGSALVAGLFPRPVSLPVGAVVTQYLTATGIVFWSIDGTANGYNAMSVRLIVDPEIGGVVVSEPIVLRTATRGQLERGYPTSYAAGKPTDFVVILAYNRGDLAVRYPTTGFEGRAYTENGIERTLSIPADDWTWTGDRAKLLKLVQEHHQTVKDPVDTASIHHHGYPTSFNPLAMGYSLSLSIAGVTPGPWDGVPFPVRSVTLALPSNGPDLVTVSFAVSNLRRQAEGDQMNMPRRYSGAGFGGDFDDALTLDVGFGETANPYANFGTGAPYGTTGADPSSLAAISQDGGAAARYAADHPRARSGEMVGPPLVTGPPQLPRAADQPPPQVAADDRPLSERRRRPRPQDMGG